MNAQTTIHAAAGLFAATMTTKSLADVLGAYKTAKSAVIETRAPYPILSCVMLSATASGVRIIGTDSDMALAVDVPADVTGSGQVVVEFEALKKAVTGARGETVRIVDQGGAVTLQHDGGNMRLQSRKVADWPEFVIFSQPEGVTFRYHAPTLKSDLDRLAPCMSTEETRYYLNGVLFHAPEGLLTMAATDGHRCGKLSRPFADAEEIPASIVPRKAIEWARRKVAKFAGEAPVSITLGDKMFAIQAGAARLTGRLVDGTFPDYERIIPKHAPGEAHVIALGADALKDATKTATAHMGRGTKAMCLSAGEWGASVLGRDVETGVGYSMLDAEYRAKVEETPESEPEPVDQPDEVAALREAVAALTARLDAIENRQPIEPVAKRTAAHERAVRRAWSERKARRKAERLTMEAEDRYIAENERASAAEAKVGFLSRTVDRLKRIVAGRKAQLVAALVDQHKSQTVSLETPVDQPRQPEPVITPVPAKPEPICKAPEPRAFEDEDLDGAGYAAAA